MRILRYIEISFAFILRTFLSVEDSSSVCRKLIVFLKLFTRECLRLFLIMNPGNGLSIFLRIIRIVPRRPPSSFPPLANRAVIFSQPVFSSFKLSLLIFSQSFICLLYIHVE